MASKMWAVLSTWFIIWFLIRLLGWSLEWFENDWIWTTVYLIASVFCVTRYNMLKYPQGFKYNNKKEVN
jgi:hypothetical protein